MHESDTVYDVIIVGGGLAGLSLAILLRKQELSVLVLEKKQYPAHKVCGEYISNESKAFLERIGIPISEMNLPQINSVVLTHDNRSVRSEMPLGGFGISRFTLDHFLLQQAESLGVKVLQGTTCTGYEKVEHHYHVRTLNTHYGAKQLVAGFGKYSFGEFYKSNKLKQNWIGVKYHFKTTGDPATIALHTFRWGYAGFSKIEGDQYCFCYLTQSRLLKKYNQSIEKLEQQVLCQNPQIKAILDSNRHANVKPLVISNISFHVKKPVHDHVFYIGDSAGTIAPLTGNGMSNAMRSAHLLAPILVSLVREECNQLQAEARYRKAWYAHFSTRITKGRWLQFFFCQPILTPWLLQLLVIFPKLKSILIKQSHGEPF
jgi:flavin-dependent dehydrogenase